MLYKKIQLLIDYVNDKPISVQLTNNEVSKLIDICKGHSLLPLLYKACLKYEIKLDDKQSSFLRKQYNYQLMKEATQQCELEMILTEFNNQKIKCLPLKGIFLKDLYPSQELRTMGDLDILVMDKDLKRVKKILVNYGYDCRKSGGKDDAYHKDPFMHVEIHRIMVDGNFELIADYYKNIWDVIKPINENSNIYKMTNEDFYIHMISHIASHYATSGIGIRFVFDVWLFLKKYEESMNFDYINHELDKINLLKFNNNFTSMTFKWFKGIETSELEESMSLYIFNSGTFGTLKNKQSVELVLGKNGMKSFKTSKFLYMIKLIFPSFKYMKNRNVILKKIPILLPYFYVQRLFVALSRKKKLAIQSIKGLDDFNKDYSEKLKKLHEDSGI